MNAYVQDHILYLVPESDLTATHVEPLRDFFYDAVTQHPEVSLIRFDVEGVELVDSLGINLIVGIYRQAASANKTIQVIGAGDNFMKVANFFRLSSIFSISAKKD